MGQAWHGFAGTMYTSACKSKKAMKHQDTRVALAGSQTQEDERRPPTPAAYPPRALRRVAAACAWRPIRARRHRGMAVPPRHTLGVI